MKLAKLSLAAIVVAGLASSSFAADTLADAFKNGKVSGELKAYYFDRAPIVNDGKTTTIKDADIFNAGLMLNYVTDSLNGFKMGVTMQSNYSPFADKDAKDTFEADIYGSGAVLSEAYLAYTMKNTTVTVGRQFINTPLVSGSGSRMIKQSFEGATIVNTDLPATTLVGGVVTKFQARTDVNSNGTAVYDGDVGDFYGLNSNDNHAHTLLAINKSITNTTLTAQWAEVDTLANDYYVEVAYAGKADAFTYGLAANYLMTDYDRANSAGSKTDDTASMYGAKVSLGYGDFNSYVAYTKIADGANPYAGLGSGAQPAFAKGIQFVAGTYYADTTAYSLDLNYNFKALGLLTGARFTSVKFDSAIAGTGTDSAYANTPTKAYAGDKRNYTDIYAVYNFSGALKGLTADVSYMDASGDVAGHDFWFKAGYKF